MRLERDTSSSELVNPGDRGTMPPVSALTKRFCRRAPVRIANSARVRAWRSTSSVSASLVANPVNGESV